MCLRKFNEYSFFNNFVSGCVKHTFVKTYESFEIWI